MSGLIFCFAGLIAVLVSILFTLREIKYEIERLTDMFNKKYFD